MTAITRSLARFATNTLPAGMRRQGTQAFVNCGSLEPLAKLPGVEG